MHCTRLSAARATFFSMNGKLFQVCHANKIDKLKILNDAKTNQMRTIGREDFTFQELMEFAKPYALLCGDLATFAQACANEVRESGEPAFYLTTQKSIAEPGRFPTGLLMHSYDESKGQSQVIASMDIARPEYKDNVHGFKGNHLVVALIETVREKIQCMLPEGVEVLTSYATWSSLTHGPGYAELKAKRALERSIPLDATSLKAAKRARL